jgi:hypothetical protein
MARVSNDRTFVIKTYKISNGSLVCSVTDISTGERWVSEATPELQRILRLTAPEAHIVGN